MVRWGRSIILPIPSPNTGDKKYLPWKDAAMGRKASRWCEPTPCPVCSGLNIKVLVNSCCLLLENKISARLVHVGLSVCVQMSQVRSKEHVSWKVLMISPHMHILVHNEYALATFLYLSLSVKSFAFSSRAHLCVCVCVCDASLR